MKTKVLSVILFLAACAAAVMPWVACAMLQPVIDVTKVCAGQATDAVAAQLVPELEAVLACSFADPSEIPGCAFAGVTDLAARWGEEALLCALAQIAGRKSAGPYDAPSSVVQRRAAEIYKQRTAQ